MTVLLLMNFHMRVLVLYCCPRAGYPGGPSSHPNQQGGSQPGSEGQLCWICPGENQPSLSTGYNLNPFHSSIYSRRERQEQVLQSYRFIHIGVCPDPTLWSQWEVNYWLDWCQAEFGLHCLASDLRGLQGGDLCGLDREAFLGLMSDCTAGEILWEHLDHIRRGKGMFQPKKQFFQTHGFV